MNPEQKSRWQAGSAPVAVVMISLNEAHNMEAVLQNLKGWAREVFLVDSYSADDTVEIALRHGVNVVQRAFNGFGEQWNFALQSLPITAPWTMKLDPDERLSDSLKREITDVASQNDTDGFTCPIRLFFMTKPLPIRLNLLRLWRTGMAHFSSVGVNEHAFVQGRAAKLRADIEHHDSPDLHHWLDKQNRYTTAEAIASYQKRALADRPLLFGSPLQRRMWFKKHFMNLPFRYVALFLYHYFILGAFRAGWVGYAWSCLRTDVYRLWEYKLREIELTGRLPLQLPRAPGQPNPRVRQYR